MDINYFYSLCDQIYQEKSISKNDQKYYKIYNMGIECIQSSKNTIQTKINVIYNLISIYPDHPELYYFMGCIHNNHDISIYNSLYWFMTALEKFIQFRTINNKIHHYEIENWLDLFKILFDSGEKYTKKIQELLDKYQEIINYYVETIKEIRMVHFLGAFYIKSSQLRRAHKIYKILLDPSFPKDKEMEYQIHNNSLVLFTRMAHFESLHELLKRNLEICQSMDSLPNVDFKTKCNLFCSNMLQYDYIYHDSIDRRRLCEGMVETFFPVKPYIPISKPNSNKITIGYVSADFLHHAVSNFILPILASHNTERYRIVLFVCQYYHKFVTEPQYKIIQDKCDFVNFENVSTEQGVKLIKDNYVDILFDLHGYTEKNRLDIFAKNPAPCQVSYLGFPNTIGSKRILQWRITDSIADPIDSKQWWTEKKVYLNGGFLLYKSIVQNNIIPFNKPMYPWIVFGSLNRESKNTPEVLNCWREILHRAPHTKLLIKLSTTEDDEIHIQNYREKLGVSMERLVFAKYGSTEDYFRLFGCIDIMLDCFPYSGTTTTCNALYNSIPVITMSHPDLHSHNVSSSLLHHIGFPELIATNQEEYINKAIELSKDYSRLNMYRDQKVIHQKFKDWMNPERFMKDYESAIEYIWNNNII